MKRYMLFFNNSEFTRNLWMRTAKVKFLLQALFLILIYFSLVSNITEHERISIGIIIFVIVTTMMGTHAVNQSLLLEFREGTWDYQRLSGISTYKMMMGKLFGASFNEWLLGSFALILSIIPGKNSSTNTIEETALIILVLIFFTIFLHAFTLTLTLIQWQRNDQRFSKVIAHGSYITFITLLLIMFYGGGLARELFVANHTSIALLGFIQLTSKQFVVVFSIIAAAWAVFALYLRFNVEFNHHINPVYWLSFILFCWIFFGTTQFSHLPEGLTANLFGTYFGVVGKLYIWVIISCYVLLLLLSPKPKYWIKITRIVQFGNYKKLIHCIPSWLTSYVFILLLPIALMIFYPTNEQSTFITGMQFLSLTLFVTRDLLIMIYLSLTRTKDSVLLIFLIIYFLVPNMFSSVLSGLFFPLLTLPNSTLELVISILSPAIQSGIMIFLLISNWECFIPKFEE